VERVDASSRGLFLDSSEPLVQIVIVGITPDGPFSFAPRARHRLSALAWLLACLAAAAAVGCGSDGSGAAGVSGSAGAAGVSGSAGAAGVSGSAGAAGVSGSAGAAGVSGPTTEPGIVVNIGTERVEYRNDASVYAGRPPMLEVWAGSATSGSFRIVVAPATRSDTIAAGGVYPCRPIGAPFIMVTDYGATGKQYDTYQAPGGSCTITVVDVGTGAGARFSGTFNAVLREPGGESELIVTNGSFLGVLTE
jgi:hypothetical protein